MEQPTENRATRMRGPRVRKNLPQTMDWLDLRACAGLTPEESDATFFPDRENRAAAVRASRGYCGRCPVRAECLDTAIASHSVGIFAGTVTSTRERMGRRRSRQKCPACLAPSVFRVMPDPDGGRVSELCVSCGTSWPAENEPATGAQLLELPSQVTRLRPREPVAPAGSGRPAPTPPPTAMPA